MINNLTVTPIKLRSPGKLATTGITNEIADKFNKSQNLPETGQASASGSRSYIVMVLITGPKDSRQGWYAAKGYVSLPSNVKADVTAKTKLKTSSFGVAASNNNVVVWSAGEVLGGPSLPTGSVLPVAIITTDSTGTPVGVVLNSPSFFPVLVKQNAGSDGTGTTMASWTYDLYALWDTGNLNKLNTSALQPVRSAARTQFGSITKATNNSEAMAYLAADGTLKLWDCQEIRAAAQVCT